MFPVAEHLGGGAGGDALALAQEVHFFACELVGEHVEHVLGSAVALSVHGYLGLVHVIGKEVYLTSSSPSRRNSQDCRSQSRNHQPQ